MTHDTPRTPSQHDPSEHELRVRLLAFVRPYWKTALLALAVMLTFALVDTALVSLLKRAVDQSLAPVGEFRDLSPAARYANLINIALLYGALALVAFAMRFAQVYVLTSLGQRVVRDLRHALFAKFQRLHLAYFDRNPVGRLMTRVTSDVDAIQQFLTQGLVGLAQDALLLVVFSSAMLLYDWRLALVAFTSLPVMLAVTAWLRVRMRTAFRETRTRHAILNAYLAENISGMGTVQLFGREKRNGQAFGKLNHALLRANLDTIKWYSLFYPAVALIAELGLALTLWYGGLRSLDGAVTIGTLVAMIELLRRLFVPLQDLADKFNILQAAMASAERIFEVLDEKEVLRDPPTPRPLTRLSGEVELRDVWFAYQDGDGEVAQDEWVLRGVNLHIRAGESVALVGATGAGKTSVISLVSRFYDVQRGAVLVDGVDVREFAQRDLRRSVGLVLQDVFLFTGTISSNLTLGNPEIPRERLIEVCRFVGAHDFIVELPHGYDSEVRERGATLSSGQKQLLAFARALIQNPDVILVLDEATANIDTETEQRLQSALEKLMLGRTSIIIAHRLSTIEHVDRIVVMRQGEIVEQGPHRELLARGGYYARLHAAQQHGATAAHD
ncbi:ABC transporter ATP-binding protein [Deinococcus peraridilitoris]|uniref:ABC-type multidrug transport system, ATPase and permease component n=1 Tax=Deinococcus peraridilitoris (strain DSM 19664 / LMG 22246 / CIP 109416 / KR-200) TaxID=937777 RepID=L0A3U1_DEIPD|nr:ABC transporter ATP-binding protein [Deinococcus peraridilitoris]AFZ67670.1 ABC-type multidrug transport system, ATPase and permease component [Deinococcus peraridilitoris DSM 19664]